MNNELNKHKTSDKVKWWLTLIAFLLMGVTIGGLLLGYIKPLEQPIKEPVEQEQEAVVDTGGYKTDFVNTEGVSLFAATPMRYSKTTGTATQEIYAVVRPTTAENRNITWDVSWKEAKDEDVSQYITVTPNGTESYFTKVIVTCYKPFEGDIVITATTEEGGFKAECLVQFVGYPTGLEVETNAYYDGEKYLLGPTGEFVLDVATYNVFNQLGEQYKNLEVTFYYYGAFTADTYKYNYSAETWSWNGNEKTIKVEDVKDKYMTATYDNGRITINTSQAIEDYYSEYEYMDGGRTRYYTDKYKEEISECYLLAVIRQPESGLVKQLKFVVDNARVSKVDMMQSMLF